MHAILDSFYLPLLYNRLKNDILTTLLRVVTWPALTEWTMQSSQTELKSVDTSEAMNYANNNDSLGWLDKVWKYSLTHNADTTQTLICMHQQYN